jgi:hypothetical protein
MVPPFLVVVTDSESTTPRDRDGITHLLRAKGWDVWHWMVDVWVVMGHPADTKATRLVEEIRDTIGQVYVIAFVIPPDADVGAFLPITAIPWLINRFRPEEAARKKSETAGSAE